MVFAAFAHNILLDDIRFVWAQHCQGDVQRTADSLQLIVSGLLYGQGRRRHQHRVSGIQNNFNCFCQYAVVLSAKGLKPEQYLAFPSVLLHAFQQVLKEYLQLLKEKLFVVQPFGVLNLIVHSFQGLLELADDQMVDVGQAQHHVESVLAVEHEDFILAVRSLKAQ